jgi:hypothetical protein
MKNKTEISLIYKKYIPEDWIIEFVGNIKSDEICFKKHVDQENFSNFSGPELSDLIVFIKHNSDSIFLAPALYDLLKFNIISVWKKLSSLTGKNKSRNGKNDTQKKISIRYEDSKNRRIVINLEGEIDDKLIENVVAKSFDIIQHNNEDVFQRSEIVNTSFGTESVTYDYNPATKTIEPQKVSKYSDIDALIKFAKDNFSS